MRNTSPMLRQLALLKIRTRRVLEPEIESFSAAALAGISGSDAQPPRADHLLHHLYSRLAQFVRD